jgi:hypothetical protein
MFQKDSASMKTMSRYGEKVNEVPGTVPTFTVTERYFQQSQII